MPKGKAIIARHLLIGMLFVFDFRLPPGHIFRMCVVFQRLAPSRGGTEDLYEILHVLANKLLSDNRIYQK